MAWRRKKKVPTKSLALAIAPVVDVSATLLSPEEVLQVRQLEDRRSMETREELQRIRAMGKVEELKKRLDGKIGQNLYRKLNTGPLGKKYKSSVSRSGSMKGRGVDRGNIGGRNHRRVSSDSGSVQSKEDTYVGFTTREENRLEQIQELAAIKDMGIMQSSTGSDSRVNKHLQHHIARMSNHRLMIRLHGGRGSERKKSSVLVTSMEDSEEQARQLYHRQSKVVIEGIMQGPSHKQRVLEKLSSSLRARSKNRTSKKSKAWGLETIFQEKTVDSEEPPRSHPVPVSPTSPHQILTSLLAPRTSPPPISPPEIPASSPRTPTHGFPGAPPVSAPPIHGSALHSSVSPLLPIPSSLDPPVLEFNAETVTYFDAIEGESVRTTGGSRDGGGVASSGIITCDGDSGNDSDSGGVVSKGVRSGMPEDGSSGASDRSDEVADSDEFMGMGKRGQGEEGGPPTQHQRTLIDDPELLDEPTAVSSTSLSEGDMEAYFIPPLLTSHGHYSTVEVDINPFAAEFEAGHNSSGVICSVDTQSIHVVDFLGPPLPTPGHNIEIPRKAFQDPRFIAYIQELDHEPLVQDYITFKMGVIGDLIEEQYAEKLSQAMDEVFIELVEQKLSWDTFQHISKRLLLQGRKIQDGIILIPCFARQLMDFVPHLGSTIGQYTEVMLDTYASENILGMGGWGSLIESYGEDVTFSKQYPYEEQDWESAVVMTPGSAVTLPVRKNLRTGSSLSEMDPNPVHNYPSPFPLRRCVSVEVLLGEPAHENPSTLPLNASPAQSVYSRSASINSLNLATPNTPSSPTFSYVYKNQITHRGNRTRGIRRRCQRTICMPSQSQLMEFQLAQSRRSVIIISGHTHNEDNGFELVGVEGAGSRDPLHKSLPGPGEYMDSLYSGREGRKDCATPPSREGTTPSSRESATHPLGNESEPEEAGRPMGRRWRSVVELLRPVTVLTAHFVAMGCWYFSRQ